MTRKRRTVATVDSRSYASVTGSPTENISPVEQKMLQVKERLRVLLPRCQDGMTLNEARRLCPLLCDEELLRNYPSVRHLLSAIPSVVHLRGVGVQTRLFPAAA